jgi:hypothetical protein
MDRVAVVPEPRPAIDRQAQWPVKIDDLSLLCDEGCGANGAIFVPLRAGKEYPEKGEAFAMGTHSIASTGRFHPALPILGIRASLDPRWSPIGG